MGLNMTGPPCPSCGTLITKVILTRKDMQESTFVRRRCCESCGHRFYTAQSLEQPAQVQWVTVGRKNLPVVNPWAEVA